MQDQDRHEPREQERRNKINEKSGLKTLGAGLRQIRNEKNLTLIEVAESADMTLSVYHRIEMGQREVSDKEFKNIAKAINMAPEELKEQIKALEDKGMLEEIIQRNDAKYKLLSTPRGAISAFGNSSGKPVNAAQAFSFCPSSCIDMQKREKPSNSIREPKQSIGLLDLAMGMR